jgi:hypothetical protein
MPQNKPLNAPKSHEPPPVIDCLGASRFAPNTEKCKNLIALIGLIVFVVGDGVTIFQGLRG